MALYLVAYTFIGCCVAIGFFVDELQTEPVNRLLPYLLFFAGFWPAIILIRLVAKFAN